MTTSTTIDDVDRQRSADATCATDAPTDDRTSYALEFFIFDFRFVRRIDVMAFFFFEKKKNKMFYLFVCATFLFACVHSANAFAT